MLPRVLEPEAMDTPAEASNYDAMDHSVVNAQFVADFRAAHGSCRRGEILDMGTGPARIPVALCQADPLARVLAIDLADHMLKVAHANIQAAGLSRRIRLVRGDAKHLAQPDGAFEGVVSNTLIHHIPHPGPALAEMARLVAPGGTLLVRDLARPTDLATLTELVKTYAGAESPAAQALFHASLHAALTIDEVRSLLNGLGLAFDSLTMTSDRHWTWLWRRPKER